MIYLTYPAWVVINLFMTFCIAYPFSPLFPLFAEQRNGWLDNGSKWGMGPRLPTWLNWLMTPDNSLDGDSTFEKINGRSYWSKVKWLWRNPAYSCGLRYLNNPYYTKVRGNNAIKDNDNAISGWVFVNANGLFQFVAIIPIGLSRCIMVNIGWNIRALVDDNIMPKPLNYQATFAFTPFRLSGFR
jgi:hypothetical protein